MTDPKIEYLESVHKSDAAVKLMLNGAALVLQGGVEGLQVVAEMAPDQLLEAIQGLATVLKMVQDEKLQMIEDHFKLLDQLDKFEADIRKNL